MRISQAKLLRGNRSVRNPPVMSRERVPRALKTPLNQGSLYVASGIGTSRRANAMPMTATSSRPPRISRIQANTILIRTLAEDDGSMDVKCPDITFDFTASISPDMEIV